MKLIVGLGNPGREYENTRHNVGFIVLDDYLGDVSWKTKFDALIYKKDDVIFVKPSTYMNLSGNAVRKVVDYYDVELKDILIICDDLDQEIGKYKIKVVSGSGGHNGLNSIISSLNTSSFARLKIGISNDKNIDSKDYVLGKISKSDELVFKDLMPKFHDIIDTFVNYGIDKTLNTYKLGDME